MIYSKYEVMKRCISGMNFPDYRYEQLIKMIFAQHIPDFHSMYMLPERLRSNLAETFGTSVCGLVPVTHRASGQADKVLFQLKDGNCVETVNLHYKKRMGIFLRLISMRLWVWLQILRNRCYRTQTQYDR